MLLPMYYVLVIESSPPELGEMKVSSSVPVYTHIYV